MNSTSLRGSWLWELIMRIRFESFWQISIPVPISTWRIQTWRLFCNAAELLLHWEAMSSFKCKLGDNSPQRLQIQKIRFVKRQTPRNIQTINHIFFYFKKKEEERKRCLWRRRTAIKNSQKEIQPPLTVKDLDLQSRNLNFDKTHHSVTRIHKNRWESQFWATVAGYKLDSFIGGIFFVLEFVCEMKELMIDMLLWYLLKRNISRFVCGNLNEGPQLSSSLWMHSTWHPFPRNDCITSCNFRAIQNAWNYQ